MSDTTRIGLDCRLAGPDHAGIGRYIENLIWRLPDISGPKYHWVFFVSSPKQQRQLTERAPDKAWGRQVTFILAPERHYSLAEQWSLPSIFHQAQLQLLHVPHFNVPWRYRGRFVLTIHDLLWHEYQGLRVTTLAPWSYWIKYLGYKFITSQAIRRSLAIFVPSQSVASSLRKYYPQTPAPVIVTPEGVADTLLPLPQKELQTDLQQILYVGSLYPHKNVMVILQALALDQKLKLHVVSARSAFARNVQDQAKSLGVEPQVTWHWQVSDQQLRQLYRRSLVLIQPSKSEGFGLTGLEAMKLGIPVIAAETSVFREVYGDAALYFHPDQPHKLLTQIHQLQHEPQRWQSQRQRGQSWAQRFSWDEMAAQTFAGYQSVLAQYGQT